MKGWRKKSGAEGRPGTVNVDSDGLFSCNGFRCAQSVATNIRYLPVSRSDGQFRVVTPWSPLLLPPGLQRGLQSFGQAVAGFESDALNGFGITHPTCSGQFIDLFTVKKRVNTKGFTE